MELLNEFKVDVPIETCWALLTDLEKIAPCLPGAILEEVKGDEYLGAIKVKVGPITAAYKGFAKFLELDSASKSAVIFAEGRETKGQGNASAKIHFRLDEVETSTKVTVTTELTITGKIAALGRGMISDISKKLIGQFVKSLEALIASEPVGSGLKDRESIAPELGASETTQSAASNENFSNAAPLNLVKTAGGTVAKRILPAIGATIFFMILVFWRRSSKRTKGA